MSLDQRILPAQGLADGGFRANVFFDVDPEQFPDGINVSVFKPGGLEVLGTVTLVKGSLLMYIDPTAAEYLRRAFKAVTPPLGAVRTDEAPPRKP